MHVTVNRRAIKADKGIVSQKDMGITLFAFVGFHILMPEKFGIVGSREQFENFNHFWRVIGYMLGTRDEFNCCGETVDDTRGRLEAMREDMLLPYLLKAGPEYERYVRVAVDGMWHFDPFDNYYDPVMFITKRAIGVPGYHFFSSEAPGKSNREVLQHFSFFQKFKILLDIVVYEYLSHVFIFRWLFNILRISLAILDFYPFLALKSFGKKFAYVEIMKSKAN